MPVGYLTRLVLFASLTLAGCGSTTSVTSSPSVGDAGCEASALADGGGEVAEPDAGESACPVGACNYQSQRGCASGQACRPQFSAASPVVAPGCEPAGSGRNGDSCEVGSDCAAGYFCVDSVCRKQCCGGDWSACEEGEGCFRPLQVSSGGMPQSSGMSLCFPVGGCDPLTPNSCGVGSSCAIVDGRGSVACIPASTAKSGQPCDSGGACAEGALCIVGEGQPSVCRALCRADTCGEPNCPAGQGDCIHFSRDPAAVGECTPE